MPIKTTNLSYEEFYNKLFSLLRLVKGLEQRFMLIVQMIQKLPLV